jgi:hypothetical protein
MDELQNLSKILLEKETAIRSLTDEKNILERLLSVKVATYTGLLQKVIEELNGPLKEIVFHSQQLQQQVGIVTRPELLSCLDKIFFSSEDLKNFLLEIEPLSHLTLPETMTTGFSLSYLLTVVKRIIPEYFQKDLKIGVVEDRCVQGDFDLLINTFRQLLMYAIGNVRKLHERRIDIGVSTEEQAVVFYIQHGGRALKNSQLSSELPHFKKIVDKLGGTIQVSENSQPAGCRYTFSFGDRFIIED